MKRILLAMLLGLGISPMAGAADYVKPLDPTQFTTIEWFGTNVVNDPLPVASGTNTVDVYSQSYSRASEMGSFLTVDVRDTATGNPIFRSLRISDLTPDGFSTLNTYTSFTDATPGDLMNEGANVTVNGSSSLTGGGMKNSTVATVDNGQTTVVDTTADTLAVSTSGYRYGGTASVSGSNGINLTSRSDAATTDSMTTRVSTADGTTTTTVTAVGDVNVSSHTASALGFGSGDSSSTTTVVRDDLAGTSTSTTTATQTVYGGSSLDARALTFVDSSSTDTTVTNCDATGTCVSTPTTATTFNGAAQVSAQGLDVMDAAGNVATYDATGVHRTNSITGHTTGLTVTDTATTLSGGTGTTTLTLNDAGAHFVTTDPVTGASGPTRITGVADGVAPNDAVNRGQLNTVDNRVTTVNNRVTQLDARVNDVAKKSYAGIAGVAALAAIPSVPGKYTLGAGVGRYQGESALALGFRANTSNVSYGIGASFNSAGNTVNAGVGFSW